MLFPILITVVCITLCHSSTLASSVTSCIQRYKYVDCSNQDLTSVPDDIPVDTETLILRNNSICILPPGIFSKYPHLLSLDLSFNKLKKLHEELFKGVHRLQTLNLGDNNNLTFDYDGFPRGVFRPIGGSLQTLLLQVDLNNHVKPILSYPDMSIADLYNLITLSISMFDDVTFREGFANLTKLQVLESHNKCDIKQLRNNTLKYFRNSHLQSIHLHSCSIKNIELWTFSGFPNLKYLDLSSNEHLGLDVAFDSLRPLENLRLREIRFSNVNSHSTSALDNAMWRKLTNICVETLDISSNMIATVDFTGILMLKYRSCFKTIRAARHIVHIFPTSIPYMNLLKNLTDLDFSGLPGPGQNNIQRILLVDQIRHMHTDYSNTDVPKPESEIPLPPYLRMLNLSYAIAHYSMNKRIKWNNASHLEVLDVAHSRIHRCYFSIEGLYNLKSLNVSNSECSDLKPEFLFGYRNLTELSFRQGGLAEGLVKDRDGIFLSKQIHLEDLDLCCNDFIRIHPDLLNQNKKIGSINLSRNKLLKIPETVLKADTLHYLDMSFNVLMSLTEHERRVLDSHVRPERPFSLVLNGNPFICSCSTVDFLEWLNNTHVTLDNAGSYSCFTENGTQTLTSYQISRLHDMRVKCVSDFWLKFSVICCSLVVLVVVVSAFGYRYRWNIKYWFLTHCTGRYNELPEEHYSYDAFVAYNHEDYQWVCGPLRTFLEETGPHKYQLCLHHRDFPVGQGIQNNIVSAMNDSRKVILVLTTRFLTCTWGEYEMEIAAMRDVTGPHGVIIAVLLDDVPTRLMPRVLLNMWKNITFLVWSQDPLEEPMFWDRLVEAIER